MRKSEVYDRCVYEIQKATLSGKFPNMNSHKSSGIFLSSTDGEAGPISRAWGCVFTDTDELVRCTEVHTSYYGESVSLEKLLKEITKL